MQGTKHLDILRRLLYIKKLCIGCITIYVSVCICTEYLNDRRTNFLRPLAVLVYGQARYHVLLHNKRDGSRRKMSCNDFHFLLVGKLAKLLMLDLATSSLCYGDVIAASSAGHGERDQVTSSSRDEFTILSFPGCFDCSIHVGVWCVLFCPVPVILCIILRAIFKFKKPDSLFLCVCVAHARVHEQEFWLCKSGFPWLVLLYIYVSFSIACKYTGVWLERSVRLHISYTQLCFSFLFFM